MPADVILVDGSSYLFRAFHAMPPLATKDGQPTGAIRGVINMLRALLAEYPKAQTIVVFDAKGPTFRNQMYDQYKANRPPMPDELRLQIEDTHAIIEAMGLPLLCLPGVEADDVIGTLAQQAVGAGLQVLISTGDKDMAQLVNSHVSLINTMNNQYLDRAAVTEKYGFGPEHMIDFLALMGDKVDNIPGVPGVGEKTALALIQGLGGLDSIYRQLDQVAGLNVRGAKSLAKKLAEHQDMAWLSHRLATIKLDVELPYGLADIRMQMPEIERLRSLYERLEFRGWLKALDQGQAPEAASAPGQSAAPSATNSSANAPAEPDHQLWQPEKIDYQALTDLEELKTYLANAQRTGRLGLWLATEGPHYLQHQITAIALSAAPGEARVLHLVADGLPQDFSLEQVMACLTPALEDFDCEIICADLKACLHALTPFAVHASRMKDDIGLMANCLNSSLKRASDLDKHYELFGLDNLSRHYLQHDSQLLAEVAGGFGKKQLPLASLSPEASLHYLAERADLSLRLFYCLRQQLAAQPSLMRLYQDIEMPLVPVLAQVEQNGTLVDAQQLQAMTQVFSEQADRIAEQAYELAGETFNLDSPKQLAEILFNKMGLTAGKKTATGQSSTNEEVLSELALTHELPALILKNRRIRKLMGTYTQPLPLLIQAQTGRVHTSYHQTGAATGRFSSTDPNLQNIPIRYPEGRQIRQAFVARPGWQILAADYSQIELRIMTHLSSDAALIKAFQAGEDIHKATAADIMGVNLEQVTADMRRNAKAINFGLIYGMSAFGLAKQLGIDRKQASNYVASYFARYPGVKDYMEATREQARSQGYVETLYGRRLYLPGITASNAIARAAAERTAINAPMQGTAADIIKKAMIDVQSWLQSSKLNAMMIMQVHDELVFEVDPEQLTCIRSGILLRMQHAASLRVPLVVDIGLGDNWDQAH